MNTDTVHALLREGDRLVMNEYHTGRMERLMEVNILLPKLLEALRALLPALPPDPTLAAATAERPWGK